MKTISGQKLRQMMVFGANRLEAEKQLVNELNVFPVPDGDTGTNMSLTITMAVKEALACQADAVGDMAKAVSSGALRGARGNSGVILSQIFRGFYKSLKGHEEMDGALLAEALERGVETAYKAVMKPKEGTILTVAKAAATKALETALVTEDAAEVMEQALVSAEAMLEETPELLPVLKEAGVVDSGGKGLTLIFRGFLEAMKREDLELEELLALSEDEGPKSSPIPAEKTLYAGIRRLDVVLPCADEKEAEILKMAVSDALTAIGYEALRPSAQQTDPKSLRLETKKASLVPEKEIGFVAVAAGDGLQHIFTELGADVVVSGGQTMNPSTEDILEAARAVRARHVVVLPNNKNIILAAEQASKLITEKQLHVLPTRSIPQGITAMISFLPDEPVEENLRQMKENLSAVVSGSITYAIRDTHIGEIEVKEGDYIAIKDEELFTSNADLLEAAKELSKGMLSEDKGIFTIYYGADGSEAAANELRAYIEATFPGVEADVQEGGQPVYYFLLSAE